MIHSLFQKALLGETELASKYKPNQGYPQHLGVNFCGVSSLLLPLHGFQGPNSGLWVCIVYGKHLFQWNNIVGPSIHTFESIQPLGFFGEESESRPWLFHVAQVGFTRLVPEDSIQGKCRLGERMLVLFNRWLPQVERNRRYSVWATFMNENTYSHTNICIWHPTYILTYTHIKEMLQWSCR